MYIRIDVCAFVCVCTSIANASVAIIQHIPQPGIIPKPQHTWVGRTGAYAVAGYDHDLAGLNLGRFQVGSYRYRSLIEGLCIF